MRRRLLFLAPVLVFGLIALFLFRGLYMDPQVLPSVLIDKPVPTFDLPALAGRGAGHEELGLATADLSAGGVRLVNVFASWCVPCRVEHPSIKQLAKEGVTVDAINYKDRPEDALAWLAELGDPYARIGVDRNGRAGIEWGVYGVPETFIVDQSGTIVYKHVGPIQPRDLETTIRPILRKLGS